MALYVCIEQKTSKGFWILHIRQIWTWAKWNLLLLMHKVSFYVEKSIYSDFIIILNSCYIEFIIIWLAFLGYVRGSSSKYWIYFERKFWEVLWKFGMNFMKVQCLRFLRPSVNFLITIFEVGKTYSISLVVDIGREGSFEGCHLQVMKKVYYCIKGNIIILNSVSTFVNFF